MRAIGRKAVSQKSVGEVAKIWLLCGSKIEKISGIIKTLRRACLLSGFKADLFKGQVFIV